MSKYQSYDIVTLNNLNTCFNGGNVILNLPIGNVTFYAHEVHDNQDESYLWHGTSLSNLTGTFRFYKTQNNEVTGSININNPNVSYDIMSLSGTTHVLLNVNPSFINLPECATEYNDVQPPSQLSPTLPDDVAAQSGSPCGHKRISVLFFYTYAAANYVIHPREVAKQVIQEINLTCKASELTVNDVNYEYITTLPFPLYTEKPSISETLIDFGTSTYIKPIRDQYRADIAVLLTNRQFNNSLVGLAGSNPATKKDFSFVIADINASNTLMTGSHELGHITGARHQRCNTPCGNIKGCDNKTKHHGFNIASTSAFGTLMYTGNPCSLARVAEFSSPTGTYMGLSPTGNNENNNRKAIKDNAGTVACIFDSPPNNTEMLNVNIGGPEETGCGQGIWTAFVASTIAILPLQYQWQVSANGFNNWINVGSSNQISEFVLYQALTNVDCGDSFFLRCNVTDSSNPPMNGSFTIKIKLNCCFKANEIDQRSSEIINFILWPNPTSNIIYSTLDGNLEIYDSGGQKILNLICKKNQPIDVSCLHPGSYLVKLISEEFGYKTQKIIKL